jgi:hypothetical protein
VEPEPLQFVDLRPYLVLNAQAADTFQQLVLLELMRWPGHHDSACKRCPFTPKRAALVHCPEVEEPVRPATAWCKPAIYLLVAGSVCLAAASALAAACSPALGVACRIQLLWSFGPLGSAIELRYSLSPYLLNVTSVFVTGV